MPIPKLSTFPRSSALAADRRVRVRFASDLTTLCQTDSARVEDRWLLGKTHDISTGGAAMILSRPFQPGTTIIVEPTRVNAELSHTLQARVVYARRQPGGGWLIGCQFAQALTADELQQLL